jgi:hypothetical protein
MRHTSSHKVVKVQAEQIFSLTTVVISKCGSSDKQGIRTANHSFNTDFIVEYKQLKVDQFKYMPVNQWNKLLIGEYRIYNVSTVPTYVRGRRSC